MKAPFVVTASAVLATVASTLPAPQILTKDQLSANLTVAEPLTLDTWQKLGLESFLWNWTETNVPASESNAIQALANSFGAPNFFCGLDKFCNAGQPNTPVGLPEWYALVAIQNWNSYMNSLNTAITFATAVMSLKLPGIVTDFFPNPRDDVTEMKTMSRVMAGALSMMPFTGSFKVGASSLSGGAGFVSTMLQAPEPTDKYLKWSQVAASVGTLVQDWQSAVSRSFQSIIDAKVNGPGGIVSVIGDGKFLGSAGNVTQTDMQSSMYISLEKYTIGLALQAQKVFVFRSPWFMEGEECHEWNEAYFCEKTADGKQRSYLLGQRSDYSNGGGRKDIMNLLTNKYGYTKEMVTKGVADCYDAAGGQQVTYPFGDMLPIDSSTDCIFQVSVCSDPGWQLGLIETCEKLGVDV